MQINSSPLSMRLNLHIAQMWVFVGSGPQTSPSEPTIAPTRGVGALGHRSAPRSLVRVFVSSLSATCCSLVLPAVCKSNFREGGWNPISWGW